MKRRAVFLPVTILIIGVIACLSSPSSPQMTAISSVTQTLSSTITPLLSQTPIPTATKIDLPVPTTALKSAYSLPVEFTQPIVMLGDQLRVTVIGVSKSGESAGGGIIEVPDELKANHYLLQVELTVENLTDGPVSFGSSRSAFSLLSKLEDGSYQLPAGWCQLAHQDCAPIFVITLVDQHPFDIFVLFVVPSGTTQIYLYFLGSIPQPQY